MFLTTNNVSIKEAEEFDRHVHEHRYSRHERSWRVWQTRSWRRILSSLKKLKCLTDTFLITKTPANVEAEEFGRHVLDYQYTLHWRSWRVWQTRSWSRIYPPLKSWRAWQTCSWTPILPPLKKLKSLTDTFLIADTPSIKEAEEFDRQVLDHQHTLHWRSWRVWQTRSWSPIIPPLKTRKGFTDTFLITNTPSIE